MAFFGQLHMQAMQCTQPSPHTGLPSHSFTVFVGQTAWHFPQPMQASVAKNFLDFTKNA